MKLKEENVSRLEGAQTAMNLSQQMLSSVKYSDYLAAQTQQDYFQALYRTASGKLSYLVQESGIQTDLVTMLSLNTNHYKMSGLPKDRQFSVQAFKSAGSLFEVIDSRTQDILVPWNDEAKALISELECDQTPDRYCELLRKAQKYTVGVYNIRKLDEVGAVRRLACGVSVLDGRFYDADCGITTEGAPQETLIF